MFDKLGFELSEASSLSYKTRPQNRDSNFLNLGSEISFEGGVTGGAGACCTVSFPGQYKDLWDELVHKATHALSAVVGGLSTACVFILGPNPDRSHNEKGDERFGMHVANPECGEGKCFCHALYGETKFWGCDCPGSRDKIRLVSATTLPTHMPKHNFEQRYIIIF